MVQLNRKGKQKMNRLKKILIDAFFLTALICSVPANIYAAWLYSANGTYIDVSENELQSYLSDGWYEYPVVTLYAEDGRSEVFPEDMKEAQLTVGWYESNEVTLYAPDGKSGIFPISKRNEQLSAGWYPYPVETVYATDGRSAVIPKEQVAQWLNVGWYSEYSEMYDEYGRMVHVHWTFMNNPEQYGYFEEKPQQKMPVLLSKEDKVKRVFPEGNYFKTKDEAASHMTEVTVPIWAMKKDGTKYSATRKLTVNTSLAEDVVQIFTEIYNDPSQFPVNSLFGFSWRNTAGGGVSQHSYGTCIDINPNENYYVTPGGTPITGTHWSPGIDPYSIAEDSIVVKTFAKYGWAWGGNAWSARNNKDYMHFTYLGG